MASTKKREQTPEEQLAAALVPEEEWPYEVPDNWCWVKLGFCITKSTEKSNTCDSSVPYVGLENLESGAGITSFAGASCAKSTKSVFHQGQIMYGRLRPYLNKHDVAKDDGVCSTDILVYDVSDCAQPQYVNLFLDTKSFIEFAVSRSKGINLPRVSPAEIAEAPFPLPPLPEQRRIASRIEWLFSKLDDAEAALREVIDGSEQRQAAILHKAFTGELSKSWRIDNGSSLDAWKSTTIGACCDVGSGGTPSRKNPSYYEGDIPWVKTGEIAWGRITETEEHISQEAIDNSSAKLYQPGAVLVAMYGMGQTRGKAALLDIAATTNQAVCALEPHEGLDRRFLFYFFQRNYWDIREQSIGGNQLNLSATILKRYRIAIPPYDEQVQIVETLDDLLSRERDIAAIASSSLDAVRAMRQSILAKALRGELGTNDPNDPDAETLLVHMFANDTA